MHSLHYHFDDKTLEPIVLKLGLGRKLHLLIHQDESIFRANELQRCVWSKAGKLPLCKKGPGKSMHASGIVVELTGQLRLSSEQIEE